MYAAGITIIDCIRTAEDIAGNKAIETAMQNVGREIADGKSLSASFEATNLFPPLVLRMIKVGESTGALQESLENVAYFYTRDVRESIERPSDNDRTDDDGSFGCCDWLGHVFSIRSDL